MKKLTQIINESTEHKLALEFIASQIKGTKWENNVFLAGGAVRDSIMNLNIKDIDLVVRNIPNGGVEFAEWFCIKNKIYKPGKLDNVGGNPVIFRTYGTAKFDLRGIKYKGHDLSKVEVECVMTRKEQYKDKNRKPDVTPGTLKDDVDRRDFTVNSLLQDLSTGEILDLTGMGRQDIKDGIIRTPLDPDIIFSEDPLRILRAIRFAVKYNWKLPRFMLLALKKNAQKIEYISKERIQDELNKILISPNPDKGLRLIQWTNLSKYIMPEWNALVGLTQNKYHDKTVDKHIMDVVRGVPADLKTRLIAAFHDIGKAKTKEIIDDEVHFYKHELIGANMAADIMKRLKYPTDIIKAVKLGVENHMRLKGSGIHGEIISDKALRKLRLDLGDHLEQILDVMHSDNIAHDSAHNMPDQIPGIRKRLSLLQSIPKSQHVKLPLSGNDLIKIFNLKPGKIIGDLLKKLEDFYFENPEMSKEEAIEIIKKLLK